MRSPHLLLTAAVRGVVGRLGHGRDRSVTLEGHAYSTRAIDGCRVDGCGSRATQVVMRSDGSEIAVCARCGEELEAILGTVSVSGRPAD